MMRLHKTTVNLVASVALAGWLTNAQPARAAEDTQARGFSDAGKAALLHQLGNAVSRGDTPGVVAVVVGRDGVLSEAAPAKLDVAPPIAMPLNPTFSTPSLPHP